MEGMPISHKKAINRYAQKLLQCGHIQDTRVLFNKYLYVKAKFLLEMREDHLYELLLFLHLESSDTISVECGFPAGKGLCASCR